MGSFYYLIEKMIVIYRMTTICFANCFANTCLGTDFSKKFKSIRYLFLLEMIFLDINFSFSHEIFS